MRYRIKITTFKSMRQEFRAQKKVLFGWADLSHRGEVVHLIESNVDTRNEALDRIDKHYGGNSRRHTIEFEYITKQ